MGVMEWLGYVWRENTSFLIGARTGAFNAPTGHVFASVFEGEQNMRYIPKFGFRMSWSGLDMFGAKTHVS